MHLQDLDKKKNHHIFPVKSGLIRCLTMYLKTEQLLPAPQGSLLPGHRGGG